MCQKYAGPLDVNTDNIFFPAQMVPVIGAKNNLLNIIGFYFCGFDCTKRDKMIAVIFFNNEVSSELRRNGSHNVVFERTLKRKNGRFTKCKTI